MILWAHMNDFLTLIPKDQNYYRNWQIRRLYWKKAANLKKMKIEIGSIANMFWYIMNYQYANFGAFITSWAFLWQISIWDLVALFPAWLNPQPMRLPHPLLHQSPSASRCRQTTYGSRSSHRGNVPRCERWIAIGLFVLPGIINYLQHGRDGERSPPRDPKKSPLLFNPYSAGIDFSRQNLTSVDVRVWRLKSITAL